MGEIKKIGEEYYIEFYARGLKYQQQAGTDKRQAEELLRNIEEKIISISQKEQMLFHQKRLTVLICTNFQTGKPDSLAQNMIRCKEDMVYNTNQHYIQNSPLSGKTVANNMLQLQKQ